MRASDRHIEDASVSGITTTEYEWVVAVPEKRNYLAHLAPSSGEPTWASRHVTVLCGWSGFAKGTAPGQVLVRRTWTDIVRRPCGRCEALNKQHTEGEDS